MSKYGFNFSTFFVDSQKQFISPYFFDIFINTFNYSCSSVSIKLSYVFPIINPYFFFYCIFVVVIWLGPAPILSPFFYLFFLKYYI